MRFSGGRKRGDAAGLKQPRRPDVRGQADPAAPMLNLATLTWVRFAVWLMLGVIVYFAYGRRHSRVAMRSTSGWKSRFPAD